MRPFYFGDGEPIRTRLHCASNGYGDATRRRRVSNPRPALSHGSSFSSSAGQFEPASIAPAMDMAAPRVAGGSRIHALHFRTVLLFRRVLVNSNTPPPRSNGYGDAARRRRVSNPALHFCAALDGEVRFVVKYTYGCIGTEI